MEGGAAIGDTSSSNDSISLEAEDSGSDGEEGTLKESESREKRGMRPENGGDVGKKKLGAGKGHEGGGHSHAKAVTQGRRKVKADNVEGKRKGAGGSKGKAVDRGEVGEKEGDGMVCCCCEASVLIGGSLWVEYGVGGLPEGCRVRDDVETSAQVQALRYGQTPGASPGGVLESGDEGFQDREDGGSILRVRCGFIDKVAVDREGSKIQAW